MTLQEQIKKDLPQAMKEKDIAKKDTLRVILGEMGRADTKELTDKAVIRILKKLIKSEKELLEKKGAALIRNLSGSSKLTFPKWRQRWKSNRGSPKISIFHSLKIRCRPWDPL